MGYASLIDIFGSMIIGGVLLLVFFTVNRNATENSIIFQQDVMYLETATTVSNAAQHDFSRIGYLGDGTQALPENAITMAYADSITFQGDVRNSQVEPFQYETVNYRYYLSSNGTMMERNINGQNMFIFPIKDMEVQYLTNTGSMLPTPVSNPEDIASVQMIIDFKDPKDSENISFFIRWKRLFRTAAYTRG